MMITGWKAYGGYDWFDALKTFTQERNGLELE